ncbi:MAG: hypothetical protein GC195_12190 [Nostoc sp. RI_552]|nr:hypothetical protein [Nostoc sp. RI_552]
MDILLVTVVNTVISITLPKVLSINKKFGATKSSNKKQTQGISTPEKPSAESSSKISGAMDAV